MNTPERTRRAVDRVEELEEKAELHDDPDLHWACRLVARALKGELEAEKENEPQSRRSRIEKAIEMALSAHAGQKDKAGQPYILHPLRVMEALRPLGEDAMVAGVLHDALEDTKVTTLEIADHFGPAVVGAVVAVSRMSGESYTESVHRAAHHPLGREIKAADILDNMRPDRQTPDTAGLLRRYEKALGLLRPVLAKCNSMDSWQIAGTSTAVDFVHVCCLPPNHSGQCQCIKCGHRSGRRS